MKNYQSRNQKSSGINAWGFFSKLTYVCFVSAVVLLSPTMVHAADLTFLNIGPGAIQGDATHPDHEGEIVLQKFAFGVVQLSSGGTGIQPEFRELKIGKFVDRASPKLALSAVAGQQYSEATLTFLNDGVPDMTVKLEDVVISEVGVEHSVNEELLEMVSLAFAKVFLKIHDPSGDVEICFDARTNTQCS